MKKMTNNKVIFLKRNVGVICGLLCLILMFFNVFNYISSTEIISRGENLIWSDGFSMFNFLFNDKLDVLETNVSLLRKMFPFAHVIVWISYIAQLISFSILIHGAVSKKNLFSKIGAISLVSSVTMLILVSFDVYSLGRTVRYISIFTPFYFIALAISVIGLIAILNIKSDKRLIKRIY